MIGVGLTALALAWVYVARLYLPVCLAAVEAYRAAHVVTVAEQKPQIVIPPHIRAFAARYDDEFSRESVLARATELYDASKDWGTVAHHLEQESGE